MSWECKHQAHVIYACLVYTRKRRALRALEDSGIARLDEGGLTKKIKTVKEKEVVKNNNYLSPRAYQQPRLRKMIPKRCLIIANT